MSNAHVLQSPARAAVRWIAAYYVAWVAHVLRRVEGRIEQLPEPLVLVVHYAVGLVRIRESCINLGLRLRVGASALVTGGIATFFMM